MGHSPPRALHHPSYPCGLGNLMPGIFPHIVGELASVNSLISALSETRVNVLIVYVILCYLFIKVKVKQPHYRPGQAQMVP